MTNLEQQFTDDMIGIYQRGKKELGYNATRFIQLVSEIGGVATAKKFINAQRVSDGFIILWEKQRLDLSVEAYVLKEKYKSLFTSEELEICRKRLEEYG